MSRYLSSRLDSPSPPQSPARTYQSRNDNHEASQSAAKLAVQQAAHHRQARFVEHINQPHSRFSMGTAKQKDPSSYGPGGKPVAWTRMLIRLAQFGLAIAVAGLYGVDLHSAANAHVAENPSWVYAVAVAGMSAVTVLIYAAPVVKSQVFWFWDLLLFILWVAVFGRFATLYLHYTAPAADKNSGASAEGPDPVRMHNAVWVDLANMCLWFVTGMYGALTFFLRRRSGGNEGSAA